MSRLKPKELFDQIAADIPADLAPHILIVGSLAAAYHHRKQLQSETINTRDADVVIHPAGAFAQATAVAKRLLDNKWRAQDGCVAAPTPDSYLSVIRLEPPDSTDYFVELLGFPPASQEHASEMKPIELNGGWYALPLFRFLGVTEHGRKTAHNGLNYAAPEMMALSNLLAHREVGSVRVSRPIEGLKALRAAKDLGRVLALARLATRAETEAWALSWAAALRERFPSHCVDLAKNAGQGLRALLDDATALEEARHTIDVGLLAGKGVTVEQLHATGRQLLVDAIEPLAELVT